MDWPTSGGFYTPHNVVTNFSVHSGIAAMRPSQMSAIASGGYPAANRAYFFPVRIGSLFIASRIYWINGGTAAGNIDAGIYGSDGTRLASIGSTAQSGTNVIQSVAFGSALAMPAGAYYLAIAASSTSTTMHRAAPFFTPIACNSQTSALPLPATMSSNTAYSQDYAPLIGISALSIP